MNLFKSIPIIVALIFSFFVLGLLFFGSLPKDQILGTRFTESQVREIYNKILINSGQEERPKLNIVYSPIINAWTDGVEVTITTSMLAIFDNSDELAMVLGHEVSHYIAHDVLHGIIEGGDMLGANMEANADKLGAFIMMRAGFDVCRGKEIMHKFKQMVGDFAAPSSHPSNAYRYDQLDLPMCH